MRWTLIPLILLCTVLPSFAARRMTVAQLEQTLTADAAAHRPDAEIARKIGTIELSERLTEVTLRHLGDHFAQGSQAATALLLLADRSAFLEAPASEIPATPAPDPATQKHLLDAAQKFTIDTLPRLPNLLATRTTFNFDDSPQEVTKGAYLQRIGMHLIGSSKSEVSVRNQGANPVKDLGHTASQASGGLMSWGEFGSALLIILDDSSQGTTTWSHWEQTPAGLMAVFHYEVPKSASHYEINTSVEEIQTNGESSRWAGARTRDAGTISSWTRMIHTKPAYQGSLWIDPATGTITRVTLVADLKGNPSFERGAILVDYGPVKIADQTLMAPVRSLALSSAPPTVNTTFAGVATEWLNENLFTDYHLFASTARILTEQAATSAPVTPDAANAPSASGPAVSTQTSQPQAAPEPPPAVTEAAHALPTPSAVPPETPEPVAPPATDEQVARAKSNPTPVAPPTAAVAQSAGTTQPPPAPAQQSAAPAESGVVLRVNVNVLLVPAVVRDRQDRIVGDLTQNDFSVFDQGKPRPITGFTLVRSNPHESSENADRQLAVGEKVAPSASGSNRFEIFLFDDRHLDSSDLVRTQEAAIQVLNSPLAPNEYAAVVSIMGVNSGITQDRAVLQAAVRKVSVHRSFVHDSRDCPDIDYFSANKILNEHDQTEFQLAVAKVDACTGTREVATGSSVNIGQIEAPTEADQRLALSAARRALAVGEEDARESLNAVGTVVRAMSKLTGQRTLILVSPGFLSLSPEAMNFKSQLFDQAAESDVVINTLDARGLYTGSMDASQGGSGAFLSQSLGQTSQDHLNVMQESENALSEMANGTGGTFFANNNDLAAGLKGLMAAPEALYMLEISLKNVKSDGAYHRLAVKVDRPGLAVAARKGYVAPKAGKGKN